MSYSFLIRLAGWLVPNDDRGSALIGDWLESYGAWRAERGQQRAVALLVVDVARSIPGLACSALAERGGTGVVLRSVPAVLAGSLVFAVPLGVAGGSVPAHAVAAAMLALVVSTLLALAGGWVTGWLAGVAPRQHALVMGVGLALAGTFLSAAGRLRGPAWLVALQLAAIVAAAAHGGARHVHLTTSDEEFAYV